MRSRAAVLISLISGLGIAGTVGAQSAKDSALYVRAQQMVANGDAAGGRKLVDSVANQAQTGTAAYAEGLYWRATVASNARDSEQAYRQIIVDYPLSGRVPDALIRIGQLEAARGENAAALQHFQRLVLEHPLSPLRPEASYWVARMYFDANDPSRACVANADAMKIVPASNVELKNRIDFQQQRCRGVTLATNTAPAPAPAAAAPVTPASNVPSVKPVPPPVRPVPNVKAKLKEVPADAPASAVAERHDAVVERPVPTEAPRPPRPPREVASSTVTSAPTSAPTSVVPGKEIGSGSKVVSRAPTKEEVDRALASAAQSSLIKTRSSTAVVKTPPPRAPAKSTAATGAKEATASAGGYAVQVAAFGTKAAAEQLATKLGGRGYKAYVDGASAPYRVRIGRYTTYAAAAQELVRLKAKHIDGFVAER